MRKKDDRLLVSRVYVIALKSSSAFWNDDPLNGGSRNDRAACVGHGALYTSELKVNDPQSGGNRNHFDACPGLEPMFGLLDELVGSRWGDCQRSRNRIVRKTSGDQAHAFHLSSGQPRRRCRKSLARDQCTDVTVKTDADQTKKSAIFQSDDVLVPDEADESHPIGSARYRYDKPFGPSRSSGALENLSSDPL
jgi:hypothetical protein